MSDSENFQRTKLRKQLTQRKRGKEPSAAAASDKGANEESKVAASTVSRTARKPWFFEKTLREWAPTYMHQRPTKKMMFDIAFFTASVVVVVKFGKHMNQMLQDFVPSEASLRQQMAQAQAQMQAQQMAMQGGMGGMPPM